MTFVEVHRHERVRPVLVGDDDGSGLIYFPTYYHYMSEADQEVFAALANPVWELMRDGIACPVVHSECDYVAPTRAGDVLTQTVMVGIGRWSSMRMDHVFTGDDGHVRAFGRVVRVWVDLKTMEKQPVPVWLRELETGPADSPSDGPR